MGGSHQPLALMAILDNLTKAAKGFFIEEDESVPASATTPRPLPATTAPAAPTTPPATPAAGAPAEAPTPAVTEPEQRHRDHIANLLAGDGKDFGTYTKMVNSMASSGLTGPLLYQTAFNAFAALTGMDRPALLASAEQLAHKLADDRARVLQRHREKLGEAKAPNTPPSPLAQMQQQETQLQADVATLTEQLTAKSQQLRDLQQQVLAERQKTQTALASYELANAAAAAQLQAHRQAASEM